MRLRPIVRSSIGLGVLILVIVIIRQTGLGTGLEDLKRWIGAEVLGNGITGILLFVAVCALLTGVGVSRQIFAFAGGYAFGVTTGSALALVGGLGGVLMAFLFARVFARDLVAGWYSGKIRSVEEFFLTDPFLMTLVLRLLPISNNLLVNLVAGVSRVPVVPFFAATAIGQLPQTVVFALLGSGLIAGAAVNGTLAIALFAGSSWIGFHLYRKYRRGKEFGLAAEADERCAPTGDHQPN